MKNPERNEDWRALVREAVARQGEGDRVLKQNRSRQRSAEILAAALRVFARQGIARARVNDIGAEAGVPSASIYDYFESKEELAYAVPIRRQSEFFAEFELQSARMVSSRECLAHFLWLTTDFARRNPDWARVLYLEVWPSVLIKDARVRHVLDDYARIVVRLLNAGSAHGEWPAQPDPYQTATIFIGAINQLITTWLLYRKPRNLAVAAMPLIRRMMQLLEIPPPAPEKRRRTRAIRRRVTV